MRIHALCILILLGIASPAAAQVANVQLLRPLIGSVIVAHDGKFLGAIVSPLNARSIFNQFGSYGSDTSSASIYNQFGRYGGEFSALSPFNEFTQTPPMIVSPSGKRAYVTRNKMLSPRIDPDQLQVLRELFP